MFRRWQRQSPRSVACRKLCRNPLWHNPPTIHYHAAGIISDGKSSVQIFKPPNRRFSTLIYRWPKCGLSFWQNAKYESAHFGYCPRVYCQPSKVVPCGRSDVPGDGEVVLFCPNCMDIYHPLSSRYHCIDGQTWALSSYLVINKLMSVNILLVMSLGLQVPISGPRFRTCFSKRIATLCNWAGDRCFGLEW
jgi:hypothetical protein